MACTVDGGEFRPDHGGTGRRTSKPRGAVTNATCRAGELLGGHTLITHRAALQRACADVKATWRRWDGMPNRREPAGAVLDDEHVDTGNLRVHRLSLDPMVFVDGLTHTDRRLRVLMFLSTS